MRGIIVADDGLPAGTALCGLPPDQRSVLHGFLARHGTRLGTTGVKVSPLCLGAMMFGPFGNRDQDECVRIIHRALDAGINFIDTADVYSAGVSEEIVGRALAGRRDDAGRCCRPESGHLLPQRRALPAVWDTYRQAEKVGGETVATMATEFGWPRLHVSPPAGGGPTLT